MKRVLSFAVLSFVLAVAVAAEMQHGAPDHLVVQHDKLVWGPAPPVLPAGAELAVVQGNPMGDGFYVVRLRMPANYRIPPHWHPAAENVTVIAGTLHVGGGDKLDPAAGDAITAGGYVSLPPLMHHFAWTDGPTEVQIHGVAPFALIYVNPADDPSQPKK